jgi:hypothetical protein
MECYPAHILIIGCRMQFYYKLLAPAVARLEENTNGARHVLYDRARTALLVAHLRRVNPPLESLTERILV